MRERPKDLPEKIPEVENMWAAWKDIQRGIQRLPDYGDALQAKINTVHLALMQWHTAKERQQVRRQAWTDAEIDADNGYQVVQRAVERAQQRVGAASEDWQDYYAECYLAHYHHVSTWGYKGELAEEEVEE